MLRAPLFCLVLMAVTLSSFADSSFEKVLECTTDSDRIVTIMAMDEYLLDESQMGLIVIREDREITGMRIVNVSSAFSGEIEVSKKSIKFVSSVNFKDGSSQVMALYTNKGSDGYFTGGAEVTEFYSNGESFGSESLNLVSCY